MTAYTIRVPRFAVLAAIAAFVLASSACSAADWPSWRCDAQNRAFTPDAPAETLHLQWVLELPEPQRCWREQFDDAEKVAFDVSYEPVVSGRTMFVASMVTDSITAYETDTGRERWRFYANGPFRFAPAVWDGKLYAGNDDGHLHCLDAESGTLLWSFRQAPPQRWMLGNERLIDTWPVRGAPAVVDGTVYFAQGVWPFMGVFVYALDADSGAVRWANTGTGTMYNLHQHGGAYAFGGVAPQGYLAVTNDRVLVPGGRTPPAVFDRHTGELLYFRHSSGDVGKGAGGYRVWTQADWFFNHGLPLQNHTNFMYKLGDGKQLGTLSAQVVTDNHLVGVEGSEIVAYALKHPLEELWRIEPETNLTSVHLQAGNRLYVGGPDGLVAALSLPADGGKPHISWQGRVEGDVWRMLVADDRLFVVTEQGSICAFGPEMTETLVHRRGTIGPVTAADGWAAEVRGIVEQTGADDGYAMLWGLGSGRLMEELIRQSNLHIIAVEPDAAKVEQMRRRLTDSGVYGRRAAVVHGRPAEMNIAPYMASLVVSEDLEAAGLARGQEFVQKLFHVLRPYGGVAHLPLSRDRGDQARLAGWVERAGLENARLDAGAGHLSITREGALPGAGTWTHQYGNPQNTNYSPDHIVRAPLGVLWYGGPSNHNVLPRHLQGPTPHIVAGRLVIMGTDAISARDVYTGRELWLHRWEGVGHNYTSLEHEKQWQTGQMVYFPNQPGANKTGSPYVSLADAIYVRNGDVCRRLDPATGEVTAQFKLPDGQQWGHLLVWEDLLIAAAGPQVFEGKPFGSDGSWDGISSERLVVMDRHSGRVLWTREAEYGFRHNAIVAADGKVFVIDNLSEQPLDMLRRRGQTWTVTPMVMALDARTGDEIWASSSNTFGTWLSYSQEHDILLQSGRRGGKRVLPDEPQDKIVAHRGADGSILWERNERYGGPLGIHGDMIIGVRGQSAVNLLTGENVSRTNPVTGRLSPWRYTRAYGCGTQLLSEHLITFRSGAAGYYDLERDGGTGNFGGFRAGCTNNLVAADGVLNAPDYTRSCTCSYQIQTSLTLVHMPEMETWTYVPYSLDGARVQRLGVNLGAPGHRMSDDGLLWVDYPEAVARGATGSALEAPVHLSGRNLDWYLEHSWQFESAEGHDWVVASGLEGTANLRIKIAEDAEAEESSYTVRLHFAEPGAAKPGERMLNAWVQGRQVAHGLDVVAQAGAPRRAMVVEVADVKATSDIRVALSSSHGSKLPPVLSGVEILGDDVHIAAADAVDWPHSPAPLGGRQLEGLRQIIVGWYRAVAALV